MNIITLQNIYKSFGNNDIFTDYSLNVKKNQFVSISGESGCGKTTLLNMIGMLEKPDKGNVNILDKLNPVMDSQVGVKLLRYDISYLFQNYGLINNSTVNHNLMIATRFLKLNRKEIQNKIAEALEFVGLSGFEKRKVYELSGGEQQRIAIARTLIKPSSIVLADEPTGSLDGKNRNEIMELILKLKERGKTIVVVTHDEYVVNCSDENIKLIKNS